MDHHLLTTAALLVIAALMVPLLGTVHLMVVLPLLLARSGVHLADRRMRYTCRMNINVPDRLRGDRVVAIEARWCQPNWPLVDFAMTQIGRLSLMTTAAVRHHFIVLRLESGALVYVDKHGQRNVLLATRDRKGINSRGQWVDSSLLYVIAVEGHVTLDDVIGYVERDAFARFGLLADNCQHFAADVAEWVVSAF
jgi:hypothetical protein